MRVSDVISNVTKHKTWTSWRQGTKLRVRLSLANARFASLLSKVVYIIKRKFKCLSWIWLISSLEVKKCLFHSCLRHSWNIHVFTSLDEIKVIFTPNIWISSIYLRAHDVNITSPQRRCNVMTLHRRWGDVIFTSCACSPQRRCNVMTLHRRWGDVIFTSCACRDISSLPIQPATYPFSLVHVALNKYFCKQCRSRWDGSLCSRFSTEILLATMGMSKFKKMGDSITETQGWKT